MNDAVLKYCRTYDEENKKIKTSSDVFEHERHSDEQIRGENMSRPIKDLAADGSKQSAATVFEKRDRIQKSMGSVSAMHMIKKHIKERSPDGTSSKNATEHTTHGFK